MYLNRVVAQLHWTLVFRGLKINTQGITLYQWALICLENWHFCFTVLKSEILFSQDHARWKIPQHYFYYLSGWYSFSKCLDCNRTPVRWPSLIFPQQCLAQARRCAQRRSAKTKQTVLREHVCPSRFQLSHTGLKEDSYVEGERDTFPWNELLWDESLVWAPQMTHDPVYICAGGSPDPGSSALPAMILGSRLGVARQAHHSAPGCFAFGVKRTPQMSRHCHGNNLSPQEFQRWATGGRSWSAYPMSEFATHLCFLKS